MATFAGPSSDHLRGRIGKAARVAERRWGIDEELISTPVSATDAEGVAEADEDEASQAAGLEASEEQPPQDETSEEAEEAPEAEEEAQAGETEDAAPEAEAEPDAKDSD